MIWYSGTIENAIRQVKCMNSLLIVFIQGDDEVSHKYKAFFERGLPIEPMRYIALRIRRNSEEFIQFRKIYVTVPVPSVFLIGPNGRPWSILCSDQPYNLVEMLKEIAEKQKKGFIDSEIKMRRTRIEKARIQFRLPSNEVRSWDFPNRSTLRDVKLYLMETVHLKPGFKLLRIYPRTTFTPEDDAKTLEDLSLTPTATLIVVPVQGTIQTNVKKMIANNSFVLTVFATLFRPVFSIITYFRRLLSITGPKKFGPDRKRLSGPAPKRFCKKNPSDNVHSFAFEDSDTDSDMNTDNGNSTQQM